MLEPGQRALAARHVGVCWSRRGLTGDRDSWPTPKRRAGARAEPEVGTSGRWMSAREAGLRCGRGPYRALFLRMVKLTYSR